jgi:hypothetical protein
MSTVDPGSNWLPVTIAVPPAVAEDDIFMDGESAVTTICDPEVKVALLSSDAAM